MPDSNLLTFGSRAGSWFALALFGSVFAFLVFGICYEIRRRVPAWSRPGTVAGIFVFAALVLLLYASSLNGFYEAELRDEIVVLHYLHGGTTEVRRVDIADVRPVPVFTYRWQVRIIESSGIAHSSTRSGRNTVRVATELLRRWMAAGAGERGDVERRREVDDRLVPRPSIHRPTP